MRTAAQEHRSRIAKQYGIPDSFPKQITQARKPHDQNKPQGPRPHFFTKTNTTSPSINRIKNNIIDSLTKEKS
ncbi:hypothetical protein [Burkholderia ubonensis]|uniref:hypothetical protein n=1 Tax=Burkholderia ubonensis TaxID=101571 RepID=UPI0012FA367D|nr:hypothetical protein [Burkholderia ubonensis]